MKELVKRCGKCTFYGLESRCRCGNQTANDYGKFRASNVVGGCPWFSGELDECDFHRSTLGFGKDCSSCNHSRENMNYKCFCTLKLKGMDPQDGCNEWKKKALDNRKFETVCSLQFTKAIDAIKGEEYVYFKHGVWNQYEKTRSENAVKQIERSGYGADVQFETTEQKYYVSIPSDGDMF